MKSSLQDKTLPWVKCIEVLHGSHVGWQEQLILFPMGTNVLSNANNFYCPAIQYGCRAKPLLRLFYVGYVVQIKRTVLSLA